MSWYDKSGVLCEKEVNEEYMSVALSGLKNLKNKTTSYKYGFFKAILDNLYNSCNNKLSFDYLASTFSKIYWNVIINYNLPQKIFSKQGDKSTIEIIIDEYRKKYGSNIEVDFDLLKDAIKKEYLKKTKNLVSKDVVGALYSDFCGKIYGFDKKEKAIYFSDESILFLKNNKVILEKINYYYWIIWTEKQLSKANRSDGNIATKLDESTKRKSLDSFKNKLLGDEINPKCFYCGKDLKKGNINVDHFIPWSFVKNDFEWNFVLSCKKCNSSKSDKIPNKYYLEKICDRNKRVFGESNRTKIVELYNSSLFNGFVLWNFDYYDRNYKRYIEDTIKCDMSNHYDIFLKYLPVKSNILDIGFGSGRDMIYFYNKGYSVSGIDTCYEFVRNLKKQGFSVAQLNVLDLNDIEKYNGIWACASLLHIPSNELNDIFKKCFKALKANGIMYVSFKYGNFEGIRNDRYFIDLNEESIKNYIENTGFIIKDIKITTDVRPDRNEKWLNILLLKQ